MAASSPKPRAHTESNSAEQRLNGLIGEVPRRTQPAFNQVERSACQWLLDALSEAIDATASQKAIAIAVGEDRSQLNNELKGEGNLYLWKLGALQAEHKATLIAFADRIRARCGCVEDPKEAAEQDAQQIAAALMRLVARVR